MPKQASYRFEVAPSGRAQCQTTECKKRNEKISLHSLRVGSFVELNVGQFWSWRHWGCTTPRMLESIYNSWVENCKPREPYPSMLDGYDELPPEMQEKILRALKNGHVDDSEWKGDPEKNVPGAHGFRNIPQKPRKKADDSAINENEEANTVSIKNEPSDSPSFENEPHAGKRSTSSDTESYDYISESEIKSSGSMSYEEPGQETLSAKRDKKSTTRSQDQTVKSRRNPKRACRKSTAGTDSSPSPVKSGAFEKTPAKDAYMPKTKARNIRRLKRTTVSGNSLGAAQSPDVFLD